VTPAEPEWEIQVEELHVEGLVHEVEQAGEGIDERRRHLRLVREQARRRANGRRLLVSAGIALVGLFSLALVTLHVLIAENQFTLDRLQQTTAAEQTSYEKLRLEVAEQEAPARIVSDAEGRLGLVQPGSVTYLPAIPSQASHDVQGGGAAADGTVSNSSTAAGTITAPQGDADWPSVKPYLSGSP
jgi:hypothetical protein